MKITISEIHFGILQLPPDRQLETWRQRRCTGRRRWRGPSFSWWSTWHTNKRCNSQ